MKLFKVALINSGRSESECEMSRSKAWIATSSRRYWQNPRRASGASGARSGRPRIDQRALKLRNVFAAILMSMYVCPVAADFERITAFVTKTRVTSDGAYGGCMAALSEDPAEYLPACKSTWVAFSCDGTYTDPVSAYRMLDQAQLALATGMEVLVYVVDDKMHSGYCVASRISVASE